jgi:hypothetical membrane protein
MLDAFPCLCLCSGHKLAGLSASLLMIPAVPIGLMGALVNRTAPTLVLGLLSFLLAFVRLIGYGTSSQFYTQMRLSFISNVNEGCRLPSQTC